MAFGLWWRAMQQSHWRRIGDACAAHRTQCPVAPYLAGRLLASLVSGLYLTLKLTVVVERLRAVVVAARALALQQVHIGKYATPEEVLEGGDDVCSICQEQMQVPVVLDDCHHLFCEECILSWCERAPNATCPLCRTPVHCSASSLQSDVSCSLLPQLF